MFKIKINIECTCGNKDYKKFRIGKHRSVYHDMEIECVYCGTRFTYDF